MVTLITVMTTNLRQSNMMCNVKVLLGLIGLSNHYINRLRVDLNVASVLLKQMIRVKHQFNKSSSQDTALIYVLF